MLLCYYKKTETERINSYNPEARTGLLHSYSKTYLLTYAAHNWAAAEQTAEMDDKNLQTTQKREWTSR